MHKHLAILLLPILTACASPPPLPVMSVSMPSISVYRIGGVFGQCHTTIRINGKDMGDLLPGESMDVPLKANGTYTVSAGSGKYATTKTGQRLCDDEFARSDLIREQVVVVKDRAAVIRVATPGAFSMYIDQMK